MPENPSDRLWAIIMALMAFIQVIGLGVASWLLLQVVALQRDVAVIQADRFTTQDGHDMEKRMGAELLALWKEIEAVRRGVSQK